MNATLEGMAQALFKSWFVDFDPVIDNALAAGNPIPDELAPRAEIRRKILGERSSSCVTSSMDGAGAPSLPDTIQQGPPDHPSLPDPKSLFPAAFQFTEELGWIPEGWEVGCISDLAELNPESWTAKKHPDSVNYVDLANTKDGRINETSAYEFWEAPSRARRVLKQHDTIIGTVRPGNRSFAYIHEDGLTGSTGFAVLRANKVASRSFIYLGLTRDEVIEVFAHLADGAAYPAIRPDVVANTRITIPSSAVLQLFEDQAAPLIAKVGAHQKEAEALSRLRDTLLPKLISGDLRTSASENSTA
jgi:type I restriction enzyme S subunit